MRPLTVAASPLGFLLLYRAMDRNECDSPPNRRNVCSAGKPAYRTLGSFSVRLNVLHFQVEPLPKVLRH